MPLHLSAADILPDDPDALLVGRIWSKVIGGPCPVLCRDGEIYDLTALSPTMSGLLELDGLAELLAGEHPYLGPLDAFLNLGDGVGRHGKLLAPCDLQAIKAAGVTFAGSMIERVIEERAKGDPARADPGTECLECVVRDLAQRALDAEIGEV